MKTVNTFWQAALVFAAVTAAAVACSSSGTTVPPGDYKGVALYNSDDGYGYAHLQLTVSEAHAVTGTVQIYDFSTTSSVSAKSVPDGSLSLTVTGVTDGEDVTLTLSDDTGTVTASLGSDGTITGELALTSDPAHFTSSVSITPDTGVETAVACGQFYFFNDSKTEGGFGDAIYLVSGDGVLFGIGADENTQGTFNGTFDGGTSTCDVSSSCGNLITATFDGTYKGVPVSLDSDSETSDLEFVTEADYGPYTYSSFNAGFSNATYHGGFNANTIFCAKGIP